ncbi:MAG TPA: Sec-independent protein translocase TatB [Ornithinimicrobium sp.]|nr:Sec-independent protein translocase TatB [Ornithinimicrobium sp.]
MTFFNLTSTEIMLLVLLAVVVLGPRRLPHYASRLADLVRRARDLAEGAKEQIKQEMGPAFEDVDWRQLDPRQYDPRRIVREALTEPAPSAGSARGAAGSREGRGGATRADVTPRAQARGGGATTSPSPAAGRPFDPRRPVPFDPDAT